MAPEMPGFDGYFESGKQGVHPFDRIKNSYESDQDMHKNHAAEEAREEELYKREILGRLFGRKLTPR